MNKIILPEQVSYIIQVLEDAGYEAYAVGGCVRDSVLGREPQDWDITTSAQPNIVKNLFPRTIDTGIVHGTVTVMMGKVGYEVTTYRIDGEYEDARHPKEVIYTGDLLEDLKRRDFTINAMAYNDKNGFVDAFGGLEDLKHGIIRCVGNAKERFSEDALRMLRAIRFSAQLDFSIEDSTFEAIGELAQTMEKISAERIQVELVKLLQSNHPERIRDLYESGIAHIILPELAEAMHTPQNNPHHQYTVGEHTIRVIQEVPADRVLRIAALFHDIAKPATRTTDEKGIDHFYGHTKVGADMTQKIMRRLKFDTDTMQKVCALVRWHDERPMLSEEKIRKAIHYMGEDCFPQIFDLKRADILAQSEYHRQEKLEYLDDFKEMYERILAQGDCLNLKSLAINGRDLMELGVAQGREIGHILGALLEDVLTEPAHNNRPYLLEKVKKVYL